MMRHALALSFGVLISSTAAHAQSFNDPYAFVFGGVVFSGESNFDGLVGGAPQSVDAAYDNGGQIGIGFGANLAPNLRGEVELSFFDVDADQVFFSGNGAAAEVNVGGGLQSTALFANLLYDFNPVGAWQPYLGGGVGIARVEQDLVYGPGVRVSDSDTVPGLQLIAGAAYGLSDNLALTTDVRYRRLFDIESNRFSPAGASTGVISGDFDTLSVNVGLRLKF